MSDRLPGSSQSNPIVYRGWNIGPGDAEMGHNHAIEYAHADYDDTMHADPFDSRHGYAASVEDAKRAIDAYEDEPEEDECPDCGGVDCNINH